MAPIEHCWDLKDSRGYKKWVKYSWVENSQSGHINLAAFNSVCASLQCGNNANSFYTVTPYSRPVPAKAGGTETSWHPLLGTDDYKECLWPQGWKSKPRANHQNSKYCATEMIFIIIGAVPLPRPFKNTFCSPSVHGLISSEHANDIMVLLCTCSSLWSQQSHHPWETQELSLE